MTTKKAVILTRQQLFLARQKRREKWSYFFDTFMMYVFTLMGILASKYIPILREGGDFIISVSWSQLIISCVIAFLLLTAAEQLGGSDRKGKQKRFLWRAIAAMSYGAFWYNMIGG